MPLKRAATIVGAGAALAAWLAAAATSGNRDAVAPITVQSPAIDRRGAELAAEVSRLHERLRPSATPQQPGRNLFSFVAPKPQIPPPSEIPPRPALSEAAVVRPAAVPLRLSGIAEDVTPGAAGNPGTTIRTAIISTRGQLFLAKVGENVTARYRVARISSEVVELTDLDGGGVLRLVLK
jgi:hypothetical protein